MIVAATLALAIWIYLAAFRGAFWRFRPAREVAQKGAAPAVSAVIPARDEAGLAGRAVASVLKQRYDGELRVFLVDDHSTDATAEEVRAAAANCGAGERLTVISSQPLPGGWTGKLWAVAQGVEAALQTRPEFILLTDADIVHHPVAIASLVARAVRFDLGLASLMVRLRCRSWAEKAAIPAFVFFFFMLYPPAWINNPRKRTAGAAGGCMLVRASALSDAGGIAAIRAELIDDCALAAAIKRSGYTIWLGLADQTESIRPYDGPAPIWRMIARTAFTQLRHSWLLLAGTIVGLAVTYLAPPVIVIAGSGPARWMAAGAWVLMLSLYASAVRYYRLNPLWVLMLPLTAIFYAGATIQSAVETAAGSGGTWKGRVQDTNA